MRVERIDIDVADFLCDFCDTVIATYAKDTPITFIQHDKDATMLCGQCSKIYINN